MVEWFSFKILVHVHVHIQVLVFRWKAKLDGTHADWVLLISILHLTLHQKGNVKAALIWVISHQFKLHNLWETFRRNYFYLFTYNSRAESSINWFFILKKLPKLNPFDWVIVKLSSFDIIQSNCSNLGNQFWEISFDEINLKMILTPKYILKITNNIVEPW